ncbi:hypothetical protein BO70DRAFT_348867 [Aspergillus heteromorphus CBS 117.55]|uniref:CID domain-containing protein n=1 Tax=Aspergillus heteromorphus CBS 117.55 TaxID=1448321 RepID=A0A317X2C2_9EURO|nr:uncharacterized protein BO70DRAFT_348867 [Aspergillus heteromorphus CBS 117.55]PWY92505.1 hypothetical protein BO70DRAFT_348867 [Aspergillus heteromorphus CBS 117.55]
MSDIHHNPDLSVIIIGGGFSGLVSACQLQIKFGLQDYCIYDRQDGLGGTWRANTYPGCAIDIPGTAYSLSFAPNPGFSEWFPSQKEILAYMEDVAARFDVKRRFVGQVEWQGARWQEAMKVWEVQMKDLRTGVQFKRSCRVLLSAVGALTNPRELSVPGLKCFAGDVMHTAKWDSRVQWEGKNVVVIGNGGPVHHTAYEATYWNMLIHKYEFGCKLVSCLPQAAAHLRLRRSPPRSPNPSSKQNPSSVILPSQKTCRHWGLVAMSDDSNPKPSPGIAAKLSAIPKKSLFERQKAEAEAKRAREQAETAAVYEDFVKSFEDDSHADRHGVDGRLSRLPPSRNQPLGGPGKRHFTSSGPRMSGPGTLGPPSSLSRKRTHEGFQQLHRPRDTAQGKTGFENIAPASSAAASAFRASDDEGEATSDAKEAERAAAKPTLYLASLPPGTSPSVLKSLIPSVLSVDNVRVLRPPGQSISDRKSVAAIVTLANESAASDIDSAVSALQNRYLGWGYYLTISRHLSSAAMSSAMPVTIGLSTTSSLPFGAKPIASDIPGRLNRAPPPGMHRGGFAPPTSYGPAYGRTGPSTQVEVKAPSDLKQLKLIHMTLENLLHHGPEFEALLMSRPEVQREEKWAWIWNARSSSGVYYRWKLWEILTNNRPVAARRGAPQSLSVLFEGGANWVPPEAHIKFEYTTRMDEFVTDQDYDSSDEEMSDYEDERRHAGGAPPADGLGANNEGLGYMNPLQKAKLTHLLARLPTTHAKLRKGDVARITAFAIEHAGAGAEETVEMIVSNILNPYAYTGANPDRDAVRGLTSREQTGDLANDATELSKESLDTSSAKLVGLYLISDILSSSATSGVRHAWRYRQLFESSLKMNQVFEHLGRLEKTLGWGRLKAEKWKRSVGTLLHLWEGWCVFPQSSQEHFFQIFEKPPLTEEELQEEREKAEAERAASAFSKNKSRWKTVDEDENAGKFDPSRAPETDPNRMDIDQEPVAPLAPGEAWNFDGDFMDNIDGESMEDSSDLEEPDDDLLDEEPFEEEGDPKEQPEKPTEPSVQPESQASARKPRPKAEDMFADSDPE